MKTNVWMEKESVSVALFAFSLFLLFCQVNPVHCGGLGEWCANALSTCWGDAQFIIPLCLMAFAVSLFCNDAQCVFRGVWFLSFVLCFDGFASIFWCGDFGCIGLGISNCLKHISGGIGAGIFLIALGALSIQRIFSFSWKNVFFAICDRYTSSSNNLKPIAIYRESKTWDSYMDRSIKTIPRVNVVQNKIENRSLGQEIEVCLESFGLIGVRVVDQLTGPVVTRFFLSLPPGVRSNAIANLDRDIARSLSLMSCRVVENIDGRPEIALELPNKNREVVKFNDIYNSKAFQDFDGALTLLFGKDVSGAPVIGDLSKMPHLLVAGTTGSGKSMCLLSMLSGMILKYTPDALRLILIDPKMVEFTYFDAIGHMMMPVVTDMNIASNALSWCVSEMDRRYQLFMQNGARDIDGFNKSQNEKLPRIVIIIDEFSDLFLADKKIETLIVSLAQKARTCGIHLILSTQRPSADVITGLIKANIPARIALKTTSKIDSRIILDQSGSEQLLGNGDMLISQGGELNRVHGVYLDHAELLEIILKIKNKYPASKHIDFSSQQAESELQEKDELMDRAIELIREKGQASIRLFIRELNIGHTRASRLMQQIEREGIVVLENSEGKKEVLCKSTS